MLISYTTIWNKSQVKKLIGLVKKIVLQKIVLWTFKGKTKTTNTDQKQVFQNL